MFYSAQMADPISPKKPSGHENRRRGPHRGGKEENPENMKDIKVHTNRLSEANVN